MGNTTGNRYEQCRAWVSLQGHQATRPACKHHRCLARLSHAAAAKGCFGMLACMNFRHCQIEGTSAEAAGGLLDRIT